MTCYTVKHSGLVGSMLGSSQEVWVEAQLRSLCCVLEQETLLNSASLHLGG